VGVGEARSYETELLFKCRVVGAEDVGVAVVSETSFDRGGVGEGKCAPAAFSFVKESDALLAEGLGVLHCVHQPGKHLADFIPGLNVLTWTEGHGVLEDGAGEAEALVAVPEERHVHEEDRETLLAVVLVLGLSDLDCHVASRLLVVEGEECASSEEELGEGKGVNVRSYHDCVV